MIVFFTCKSETLRPLVKIFLLIEKVISPGLGTSKASQIDEELFLLDIEINKDCFVIEQIAKDGYANSSNKNIIVSLNK